MWGPQLDQEQMTKVAVQFGLSADVVDTFDGTICAKGFVKSLMDPLSDRSLELVDDIWEKLDPESTGFTCPADIRGVYDGRSWNEGTPIIGEYEDVNHPGAFRNITLLDEMDGDKRLARLESIGGDGEPASYVLPSYIDSDGSLYMDFSAPPKDGPGYLRAVYDTSDDTDGIVFDIDGNKWPQIHRSPSTSIFLSHFKPMGENDEGISKEAFIRVQTEYS